MAKRILAVLLAGTPVLMTGCISMLIADSGRDLNRYKSRAEVRSALGEPIAAGADGRHAFEDYRFRGKLRDRGSAQGAGTAGAMTLGLSEIFVVPPMLIALPGQMFETHEVRYYFAAGGEVERFEELQ